MNPESKRYIDEQLSYAAHDFIRDAGLHNAPGHDWDSFTEELKNFLFAKAEVWISDKATQIEAELQRKCEAAMADTEKFDNNMLVGVGQ